ncbi:MAG: pantetheine-phosphate adenylyltransferase [bacterium]
MTKKQVSAVFPGSFDPPTWGHVDLIKRSAAVFDKVIIAVAESTSKRYVFSTEERVDLWKRVLPDGLDNVEVDTFKGLLVDYMDKKNSRILLRGLRNLTDFEYEISMSQTNQTMNPKVETLFIMTAGHLSHLSSSLIKEIVMLGGSVKNMVPPLIEKELKKRIGPKSGKKE